MRKRIVAALALALASTLAFAQVQGGDSRARGMGGAMTAVNDDMNTLFYNPAGLAFLNKNYLIAEADIESMMQQGSQTASMPLYEFTESFSDYLDSDGDGNTEEWITRHGYVYFYSDGSFDRDEDGHAIFYDLSTLAAVDGPLTGEYAPVDTNGDTDGDGDVFEDDEYAAAYEKYSMDELMYNSIKYTTIDVSPRLIAGGPHWGAALMADFALTPMLSDFHGEETTTMTYLVNRRLSAVLGSGLKFGGLALGANLRYGADAAYFADDISYTDGPGDRFIAQLLTPDSSDAAACYTSYDPELAAGLGALLSLGTLNLGLYNDNVIPFIDKANMGDGFFAALADTTNLGLSWMPSDDKSGRKSPITLMAAVDVNNLGDEDYRQLAAGAELGLNLFDFMVATARLGYSQPLGVGLVDVEGDGKSLFDMRLDDIDPETGRLTAGLTAKFWFAKIDFGVAMPMSVFSYMMAERLSLDDGEYNDELVSLNLTVSASF